MFSLFESLLQQEKGWQNTFIDLNSKLRETGKIELAEKFEDFKDAINVLKHGKGHSYQKLLNRKNSLDFEIKDVDRAFFNEGDISEVDVLVDVDDRFLAKCAEVIQDVYNSCSQA
jgi:uncharacterized protein YdcH (DUF465 family)